MLNLRKSSLLVLGIAILASALVSLQTQAAGVEESNLLSSKKINPKIESVHVKITNQYGKVLFTDFKTPYDKHIDFDLQPLPIADYSIEVHHGNELINSTEVKNVSTSMNVLTVEILNSKGNQVFESENPEQQFDLSELGKGNFTVNVYRGHHLLNTRKIKN